MLSFTRRLALPAVLLAALTLAVAGSATARTVTAYPPTPASPLRIVTVGDSTTYGADGSALASYRAQLDRDLTAAGVPHVFVVEAVAGQVCQYFADRIGTYLTNDTPDVLIVWCGKNDAGYGTTRAATTAALETIASAAVNYTPRPAVYFPRQNYSDLSIASQDRVDREADVNNAITDVINEPRFQYLIGAQDLTIVPGDAFHISSDGVHPIQRGYDAIGREIYRQYLWNYVHATTQPASLCGMYGHWRGNPRPAAQACTLTPAP